MDDDEPMFRRPKMVYDEDETPLGNKPETNPLSGFFIGVAILIMCALVATVVIIGSSESQQEDLSPPTPNELCRKHDGVRQIDSHSGWVVCIDGVAREL